MQHVILLLLCISSFALAQQPNETLLLRTGKIYDSEKQIFRQNQDILIENGVITQVGNKLRKPSGARVIDLGRCTVTPGLMDAHTHLLIHQKQTQNGLADASKVPADERIRQGLGFAKENLEAGFTTVRDVGNSGQYLDVRLQKLLNSGQEPGPDLHVSGPIISPPGGQFGKLFPADSFVINQEYRVVRGVQDAEAAVMEHVAHGVNVIKVAMNTDKRVLAPDEIAVIVKTAHRNQLPVTAHATTDESARDAVLAGVDGIEHGYSLSDSTLALMSQRGTYLVPTDMSRQNALKMVIGIGMKGKEGEEYANGFLNSVHDRLKRAEQKGVMIVAGADFYTDITTIARGAGAVDVLLAYFEAGMSAARVLQYATVHAAKALRISDRVGTIKKGMKADLAVFNGDLETDFARSLFDVKLVIKNGKVYEPKAGK
ncbi:amidohydrolase family protein [Larkinella rosea]|uniref:Amidohydrolase family protein n=1 Tax=Larkinella rosea TaxID=2025312 RepID=A0A3P1BCK3_9BACT|nr:amidohydrolase family protein [Larkinella rosea]RRA98837.1 amidohydrolase family protein [Larkinella rosea]